MLFDFDFVITYRPEDMNGKVDALSRRTDPELEGGSVPQISLFKLGQLAQIQRDNCKSTVFYRTPAPIIVYYFPYITCLLYLLFLIKHVRTSG